MTTRILVGDVRERLADIPDQSIHCCVTSPPYFGLRSYLPDGHTDKSYELGLEPTLAEYITNMVDVFREVRRVLRDDGTVFLNIGDSYFGGGGYYPDAPSNQPDAAKARRAPGAQISGARIKGRGGVRRGAAYGRPDTTPEDCRGRDCLCGSLCDACRVAYRTGIARSGVRPVPTQAPSPSEPIHGHTACPSVHLPTSGSAGRGGHTGDAIPGLALSLGHGDAQPLGVRASNLDESSLLSPVACLPVETPDAECRLCGRSLAGCAPASERTKACPCASRTDLLSTSDHRASTDGSGGIVGSSASRIAGKAYDLAYPYYTTASRLKPKDLMMVPARLALALVDDGWYLRSDIIWAKRAPMPESVVDRPTASHEHIFLLTKERRYFYDAEAVRTPLTGSSIARLSQDVESQEGSHRANGGAKTNGTMKAVVRTDKQRGHGRRHEGFNERWDAMPKAEQQANGANLRNVWLLGPEPFSEAHFATFPTEIPRRCIKAGTSEHGCCEACGAPWVRQTEHEYVKSPKHGAGSVVGRHYETGSNGWDGAGYPRLNKQVSTTGWAPSCECDDGVIPCTVLDIFGGSGTTGMVADQLGRDCILVELNPDYAAMSERRIRGDAPMFADVTIETASRAGYIDSEVA